MKINLIYNKHISNYFDILTEFEKCLNDKDIQYKSFDLESMENYGELSIVSGGDGTILRASKFYSKHKIPVLGINTGRLGFLSQINTNNCEKIIELILNKKYHTENRLMLESENEIALNDFVVKGCDAYRASKFYLEINGKCVCDYIADGLIIATPTGSTAYCLSAGGTILHPSIEAITIVPICPHTLNTRPLIIPSTEKITIKADDKILSLSADGYNYSECVDKIEIKQAKTKAKLAFLDDNDFYSVLREKLHWGIAPENRY